MSAYDFRSSQRLEGTPELITVHDAAELLAQSDDEIQKRIDEERIPYVRLRRPTRVGFLIPVQGLLTTLAHDAPVRADVEPEPGGVSAEAVRAALRDD